MTRRIVTLVAAALALSALAACSSTSKSKKADKPAELVKFTAQFRPARVWSATSGQRRSPSCAWG